MKEKIEKELLGSEEVPFEELADESSSPLNEKVEDGDIGFTKKKESKVEPPAMKTEVVETPSAKQSISQNPQVKIQEKEKVVEEKEEERMDFNNEKLDDAPEQEIGSSQNKSGAAEEFELPDEHAQMAAESFLGMTDNLIELGGGYFVTIKKHKDFYDFDEIIQIIDQQNDKNITRIKLDEQDKMLLRPLLVAVIKRKAKTLTPEQQLFGVAVTIIFKKARIVMQIRAENDILVERMLDIIRREKEEMLAALKNAQAEAKAQSDRVGQNQQQVADKGKQSEVVEVAA